MPLRNLKAIKLYGMSLCKNPVDRKIQKYVVLVWLCVLFGFYIDSQSIKWFSYKWDLSKIKDTTGQLQSTRILIVSDPQLIGDDGEFWLVRPISKADSDWFLHNGYQQALKLAQPDLILFMGDLLDEGSIANDVQFEQYVDRFYKIFDTPTTIQRIFIPGDNDIGGETWDWINQKNVERFYKHFKVDLVSSHGFIDFATVKEFGRHIYEVDIRFREINTLSRLPFKVFLSHLGALDHYHYLSKEMKRIDPNLILAGHEHWPSFIKCHKCWEGFNSRRSRYMIGDSIITANISDKKNIYQIVTPTCSYRMGVKYPGYGLLDIDIKGNLKFRVLWLPNRYYFLYTYLILTIGVSTFLALKLWFYKNTLKRL